MRAPGSLIRTESSVSMAAKSRTPQIPKKATALNSKPRGIQLGRAISTQSVIGKGQKAATRALARNSGIQSRAAARMSWLQTQPAVLATNVTAKAAAVASNAANMSYRQARLGAQNTALQARIEQDMSNHLRVIQTLQYQQSVAKSSYATQAIYDQVTQAASSASKSVIPGTKVSAPRATQYKKTTGFKSAKIYKPRTAPMMHAWQTMYSYTPVAPSGGNWIGDEVTPNCVITAVANQLLFVRGIRAGEVELKELAEACSPEPTIEEVLWQVYLMNWPNRGAHVQARLRYYQEVDPDIAEANDSGGLVIGYRACTDDGWKDHASLSLTEHEVVSWGRLMAREALIEEAWELTWES